MLSCSINKTSQGVRGGGDGATRRAWEVPVCRAWRLMLVRVAFTRGSVGQRGEGEGGVSREGLLYESCLSPSSHSTAAQGLLGPLTSSLDLATTTTATVSPPLLINSHPTILTPRSPPRSCLPCYQNIINIHNTNLKLHHAGSSAGLVRSTRCPPVALLPLKKRCE